MKNTEKKRQIKNKVVFLKGKRINLRPVEKEDVPDLERWINDEEVRRNLLVFLPMNKTDEEAWVVNLSKNKGTDILMIIVAKNKSIGSVGINKISLNNRTAEIGINIGEKHCWNKGYGTEAIMLLLRYAFNTLNLRKICLEVLAFNKRAIACYKKCGFEEEGLLKKQFFRDGVYHDAVLMAIFAAHWKQ